MCFIGNLVHLQETVVFLDFQVRLSNKSISIASETLPQAPLRINPTSCVKVLPAWWVTQEWMDQGGRKEVQVP